MTQPKTQRLQVLHKTAQALHRVGALDKATMRDVDATSSTLMPSRFIAPCLPVLRRQPPRGEQWAHEVKFDGWRLQLHKSPGRRLRLFTKNGNDYTSRFPAITAALQSIPARSAILDGELVACDTNGLPDFRALHRARPDTELCVWLFDVLAINGRDLRPLPWRDRRRRLARLMQRMPPGALRYSESFDNPQALLAAAGSHDLEGIVSKRTDAPYRSGERPEWIKVKTTAWRKANRERWRLFEKSRRNGAKA